MTVSTATLTANDEFMYELDVADSLLTHWEEEEILQILSSTTLLPSETVMTPDVCMMTSTISLEGDDDSRMMTDESLSSTSISHSSDHEYFHCRLERFVSSMQASDSSRSWLQAHLPRDEQKEGTKDSVFYSEKYHELQEQRRKLAQTLENALSA